MNIVGKTKIFRNEKDGKVYYTTSVNNKNQEGKYEYMTIDIQFPKGTELENKTDVDVTNGFISFYKNKSGLPKIKFVVMDFTVPQQEAQDNFYGFGDDSDLPF